MKYFLLSIILAFSALSISLACSGGVGYIVQVENLILNSNILVKCKSNDDDLGDRHLAYDENVNWDVCFSGTTQYSCHFYWDSKEQLIDVFNKELAQDCYYDKDDNNQCYWAAMPGGLYLYNFIKNEWVYRYDWKE
ncbi:S-protein homolog 2-like [Rutidosis leptorrhynchoides]|uniref:S-protein homolog 2-like n=1 Tax=Rutidosis leptorrhynchoides TaxID=125765 RepID=UPI003A994F35